MTVSCRVTPPTGTDATHHCATCNEFLCADCTAVHGSGRKTRSHAVCHVSDTQLPAATETCKVHPGEPLKLWCDTCGKTICRDCVVVDHRSVLSRVRVTPTIECCAPYILYTLYATH